MYLCVILSHKKKYLYVQIYIYIHIYIYMKYQADVFITFIQIQNSNKIRWNLQAWQAEELEECENNKSGRNQAQKIVQQVN